MKSLVVSSSVRSLLNRVEIECLLGEVISSDDAARERILSTLLDRCVFRDLEERRSARDAMRFFYWYTLEQIKLGRKAEAEFFDLSLPVFIRFCEGAPRERNDDDVKVLRLISSNLYIPRA